MDERENLPRIQVYKKEVDKKVNGISYYEIQLYGQKFALYSKETPTSYGSTNKLVLYGFWCSLNPIDTVFLRSDHRNTWSDTVSYGK